MITIEIRVPAFSETLREGFSGRFTLTVDINRDTAEKYGVRLALFRFRSFFQLDQWIDLGFEAFYFNSSLALYQEGYFDPKIDIVGATGVGTVDLV